ncbi:DNA excision repair protein ERCC-1 [Drosophila bipectinata]|uniref:DNA excision repair protein ERCC-1 n=1 Tax=Drosophila bipectinata TaxID=42026 RepID=UPI001C8946A4|nr:DNA excision repair protein ERCC-1 [Drosophila bipectinata]
MLPSSTKQAKIDHSTVTAAAPSTSSSTGAAAKPASNPHSVLVHSKQRGNPILKSIQNVPLEYRDDIVPDYVVGRTSCVLYLSLKYHNLNPDYICQRLKTLGKMYDLRVLLVQVDTPEPHNALKSLTRISLLADLTMMLAWNHEEAGKIIETYKQFEKRPPDLIMERVESNSHQKLVTALTNIKPVNKTDAVTLLQTFGNLGNIITASEERLSQVIGLGPRKAKKLHKTLQEPFLSK